MFSAVRRLRDYLSRDGDSVWCADTRPMELLLSLSSLAFGLVLGLIPNVFESGPAFQVMHAIMPEHTWALLMLSAATFKLVGYIVHWRLWRWFGALLSLMVWGGIAGSYLAAGTQFPSGWVYLLFATAALWIVIRGPTLRGGYSGGSKTSFGPTTASRRDRDFLRARDPGRYRFLVRLRTWAASLLARRQRERTQPGPAGD